MLLKQEGLIPARELTLLVLIVREGKYTRPATTMEDEING